MIRHIYPSFLFFKEYFPYTLNFRKMYNYFKVCLEYKQKNISLTSRPYIYYIDIGNICNLRCPLCPTGSNSKKRNRLFMDYKTYCKIFNKIKDYAIEVKLFNWGEPFLNKDLFKIIRYTKKSNIYVTLSTNFNTVTDKDVYNIIKYKIDKIIISLDGAAEEGYSSYRKGGNFATVLNNILKLVYFKKEYPSKNPEIIWQYLINKKNKKELEKAKKLAEQMGIQLEPGKLLINQEIIRKDEIIDKNLIEEWIPKELQKDIRNYKFTTNPPCKFLYHSMIINPEGTISPCCAIYDSKTDFGDILHGNLKNIWNNKKFISSRKIFWGDTQSITKTICHECCSVIKK